MIFLFLIERDKNIFGYGCKKKKVWLVYDNGLLIGKEYQLYNFM